MTPKPRRTSEIFEHMIPKEKTLSLVTGEEDYAYDLSNCRRRRRLVCLLARMQVTRARAFDNCSTR